MVKNFLNIVNLFLLLLTTSVGSAYPGWESNSSVYALSTTKLETLVMEYLQKRYAEEEVRLEVRWMTPRKEWYLPHPPDSIGVRYHQNRLPKGHTVLTVVAFAKGRVFRQKSISLDVRVFRKVLVLTTLVPAGAAVGMGQVEWQEREITNLSGTPILNVDSLAQYRTRRYLHKGTILTTSVLAPPAIVEPGETLSLVYHQNQIQLTLQARSLQSGAEGDVIWFMFPDTRKRIKGKIINQHLAVVVK